MIEKVYEDNNYKIVIDISTGLIIARYNGRDAFGSVIWERTGTIAPATSMIKELHLLRKYIGEEAYLAFLTANNLEDRR